MFRVKIFNREAFAMSNEDFIANVEKLVKVMNYADGTVRDYLYKCRMFLDWCSSSNLDPAGLSLETIYDYIIYLKEKKNYAPKTINSNIAFIRFFYVYIIQRQMDRNMLPYCRVDLSEPELLSKEEIAVFINSLTNLKHKAMFVLLYSCGLRCSELVNLKLKDISGTNHRIYIEHAKNRSARYVEVSEPVLNILRTYWVKCDKPRDWLFPGQKPGTHISTATVNQIIKDTKSRLGWEDRRITSHTFRHCLGTHMYEAGCDLPYIQKCLGHKSILSTMVYITVRADGKYPNPFVSIAGDIKIG